MPMSQQVRVQTGLERCLAGPPSAPCGSRFGLLMNQASVDSRSRYACDLLAERFPDQLRAMFSPQHGLWGEQQANMIESPHGTYPPLGLPVYSLYSETRRPTAEMLKGLDVLVVDLQDVGTRIYTFVWTVLECLHACSAAGIAVVVLDRPNPIGGDVVEGPMLDPEFQSFVGNAPIPMRHALTLGELALLLADEQRIDCELHVVTMHGWRREMYFADTGLPWVAPSPNMPRLETTLVYPGQVLIEGANLSEGRGTTLPFELAGGPEIDPWQLVRSMNRFEHPGLRLRPIRFVPTFDKYARRNCGGVSLTVSDPRLVRSMRTTLALFDGVRHLAPTAFEWLPPPYEYELEKPPIDILFGSDRLRRRLDSSSPLTMDDVMELTSFDEPLWRERTLRHRLYE